MLARPISHVSYVVEDIERAVDFWVAMFGAGPFHVLERIEFDAIEHRGGPATLDHSAAFGQWGAIAVELQQVYDAQPAELAARVAGGAPRVNHIAYISPDVEADSRRLEQAGMPRFMFAKLGPVEVTFHDAPALGHAIELHRESDHIYGFFGAIAEAARGWDGSEPLRTGPPPRSEQNQSS
jgi:catechol 2,3-dioxygenase-like lactoylglutathione lyase family enzyme